MSFTEMAFNPADGLRNKTSYPTAPDSENAVRECLQASADQLRDYINEILIPALESAAAGLSGAERIGSAEITGVTGETIYAQIANLKSQLDGVSQGAVSDGSITTAKLADASVTTAKVANGAITAAKLGEDVDLSVQNNEVTTQKIANGAVTADKIATGAATSGKIGTGAVTADKIGTGAVTKIKLGSDVPQILYGSDAFPPIGSYPAGTLYVQYV